MDASAPHRPEILAPAGDRDSLQAALGQGADAVYFGLDHGFNARARATNFSLEGLPSTVAEIHRAGVRAYLTLNTLVFETELADVERIVRAAALAGVDAIIVQDPAVALISREVCSALEVHASTQMTISSPQAARFAQELGATRVVLPRELSVAEIAEFVAGSEIETEVFVHGALCVAWSGQCLTSEAWGQRSANRGQCAQSCRMPYEAVVDGELRDLGDVRYLLSPKDLAGARAIPTLIELGVHGLKIEGRQKGAHYVATAVRGYRHWVDALVIEGPTEAARTRWEEDLAAMGFAYTRGFSDGFLAGSDHQTLIEGRFPKHRGHFLGRVRRVMAPWVEVLSDPDFGRPWTGALAASTPRVGPKGTVRSPLPDLAAREPTAAFKDPRPGMGVVFDAGNPEDQKEPGGPIFGVEPLIGALGFRLQFGRPGPDLLRVAEGDRVWLTSAGPTSSVQTKVPLARWSLHLHVEGSLGNPLALRGRAGQHEVSLFGTVPAQPARGEGLSRDLLLDKVGSLGGTPFRLEELTTALELGLHVPVSELKALRRALVEKLLLLVERGTPRAVAPEGVLERLTRPAPSLAVPSNGPTLVPLCRTEEQLLACIAEGVSEVELDWMEMVGLSRAVEVARRAGLRVIVCSLRIQKPGEEGYEHGLARLEADGLLVRHWGGLMHWTQVREEARPALHGDFSLNVTNSLTARHLLDRGLTDFTPSHDLDETQLFDLLEHVPAGRVTMVLHHRIATFHTEHCVLSHLLSEGRDFRTCGRPCESQRLALRDHLAREHPVIVDAGCRNTIFNAEPQSAALLVPRLLDAGVGRFRVEFVREDGPRVRAILTAYRDLLAHRTKPEVTLDHLRVRPQQGVRHVTLSV